MTYDEEHEAIVHQLRSRGWSKDDAIQEADNAMAERIKRRNDGNAKTRG